MEIFIRGTSMNYPFLKSLISLGALMLVCSCSDDKTSPSDNGGSEIPVTCADAWYFPDQGLLAYQDQRVTDFAGNQVGTMVIFPGTTVAVVKDLAGNILINQVDLNQTTKLAGDPSKCSSNPVVQQPDASISSCLSAWYLAADKEYLIYEDFTVTDKAGNQVGKAVVVQNTVVNMIDMSGKPIVNNIDLAMQPIINGDGVRYKIVQPAYHLKDATGDYLIYETTVVTLPDGTPVGYADFTTGTIYKTDKITPITTANIAALPILLPGGKCVDLVSSVASSSSQQPVLSSSSTPPNPVSSSSKAKSSSSSQPKSSSSSTPKSSSSSAVTGQCPTIKTKGGASGSGWATRYWDCCMPSCSWNENSGGNPAKVCDSKGKNTIGNGSGSVCSGGAGATCTSQIPFTVDGCTEMAFAFAAVPASNGGQCGKCFQLTFTGEGHYSSTNANTKKLKGKKLIIMVTNIGGDVNQGQFDIMIPGGGVGAFNGCSQMGWGSQGQQYGGLLSDCETETKYSAAKYKSCLTEKCNKSFSNDEQARKGCLFLADWMGAAGNPEHNYVEVECPQVLKDKY